MRSQVRTAVVCAVLIGGCLQAASAQVVRIAPVVLQTATPAGSERLPGAVPPASDARIDPGSAFVVEVWATNVAAPINGLACVHVDLAYDRTDLMDATAPAVDSPLFTINAVPTIFDDPNGTVGDIGGCQTVPVVAMLGVGEWVLVETIDMTAIGTGGSITVSLTDANNLFAGTSIIGEIQDVAPVDIQFLTAAFVIQQCVVDGDCDDLVGCTVDSCNLVTNTCVNTATDSLCDNGLFCDGAETCDAILDCQAGTPPVVSDGIVCTDDSCDEINNVIVNTPNDANCDNGLFCDGAETCDAILDCQAGTPPVVSDGIVCTDDSCDEINNIIVNTPNDANCDNGLFCDGAETCDAVLDCQAGTPPVVSDGIVCTDDSCDEINNIIVNTPNNANCDNGLFCDGAETCDAVLDCQAGTPPVVSDGIVCTDDSCDEINNVIVNTPNDANCDNTLFCDGVETCDAVLDCQAGTPPVVSDGIVCTDDSCDEVNNVIVNTPNDANCDNGLFCDGVETCDALLDCQAGTAPVVSDGIVCTDDSCDEVNNIIVNTPNDANCDNGLFCDGAETCDALLDCQAGTPPVVSDGIVCTDDSCDEVNNVIVNTPNDANCDNALFCDGVETCDALLDCQAGTPPSIDDGVLCTDDSCDEVNNVIVNTPNNANCDNAIFCDGAETCDALLDCQPGANPCPGQLCNEVGAVCADCILDADCDDTLFCNGAETCVAGLCVAGTPIDCADTVACTVDTCDELADVCVNTATDALCDNGLFCDGAETCDALLDCQVGTAVNCDDGIVCTTGDTCDEVNDVCINVPDATLCDNGIFCDGVEVCDPVLDCQAGTPLTCDDGITCTVDGCDETNNVCLNVAADGLCDNGMFCDGIETCDALLDCQPGTPLACDDAVACTVDSCDEFNNVCVNTPFDSLCDNTQFCDGTETCDAVLGCQAGIPVSCDDTVACTIDTCDEVNDVCINTPDNVACDNGLFCDGTETCDALLGCQNTPLVCDDSVQCTVDTCDDIADSCVFTPIIGCQNCINPIDCDDGIACTMEACTAGICVLTPNDQLCANGQFCDGVETCDMLLGCQAGPAVNCDDGIGCTVDACDEIGDACTSTTNDALCDNGQFCDGVETCDAILDCQSGVAPCDDGIACTLDGCNEVIDTCIPAPVDSICDNGLFCDGAETCHPLFGCQPGTSPCDDGLFCSLDSCNEATGDCTNTLLDALCDDGDVLNGVEFCDPNLDCQPGMPVDLIGVRSVVLQVPSGLNVTTGVPPAGTDALQAGLPFVVELWAQQLQDPTSPSLFGLCCVFADFGFNSGLMSCSSVTASPLFSSFSSGTCGSGLVDEIGGCTFSPPQGVTPGWVRVATVNMNADVEGFGNTVSALPAGTSNSICQYGTVPVGQMQFDSSGVFRIGNPCMYDLDGDDCVGPGDIAFFAPCWLTTPADPQWDMFNCAASDFDCSGAVDPGDLAFFASGWLKCCDDPTIIFPPLPCGMASGQALPPASRKTVESFGLRYPDDTDTPVKSTADDGATDRRVPNPDTTKEDDSVSLRTPSAAPDEKPARSRGTRDGFGIR